LLPAFIPWFQIPPLRLGPISIEPFGVLAAAGVYLASVFLSRCAREEGLDPAPLTSFATWALIGGLVGGHLVHVLLYHPEELRSGGILQLLKVWDGLSSTGAVLGALGASLLAVLALLYGAGRFVLDFLRARDLPYVDARYLGLTPAQYFCVALVAYGAWALLARRRAADRSPPA